MALSETGAAEAGAGGESTRMVGGCCGLLWVVSVGGREGRGGEEVNE